MRIWKGWAGRHGYATESEFVGGVDAQRWGKERGTKQSRKTVETGTG